MFALYNSRLSTRELPKINEWGSKI